MGGGGASEQLPIAIPIYAYLVSHTHKWVSLSLSRYVHERSIEEQTGHFVRMSLFADVLGKRVPKPQRRNLVAGERIIQGEELLGVIKDDPD